MDTRNNNDKLPKQGMMYSDMLKILMEAFESCGIKTSHTKEPLIKKDSTIQIKFKNKNKYE